MVLQARAKTQIQLPFQKFNIPKLNPNQLLDFTQKKPSQDLWLVFYPQIINPKSYEDEIHTKAT